MIGLAVAGAMAGFAQGKAECERWSKLTPEQRAEELELRKVLALELAAKAADRESRRRGFFAGRTPL